MLNKRRRRQPPSSIPRAQKKRNKKGFFLLTASRQNVGPKVEQNVQQNVEQNVEQNVRQNVQQNVEQMLNKCWTFSFKIPWPPPSRSALPPVSVLPSLSFFVGGGGEFWKFWPWEPGWWDPKAAGPGGFEALKL